MTNIANIAIIGASGYTGSELVRLIATHPQMRITALCADRKAGMAMADVFPHLRHLDLPVLQKVDEVDFSTIDLAFCALPHATSQKVIAALPKTLKIVDLSADFRLRDPKIYEQWYGNPHAALECQAEAVYGLTEFYRDDLKHARLVAGTGCNAATGMYGILPLLEAGVIDPDGIILDMKCGVSGAGRAAKEAMLHSEVSEGINAYGIGHHRHMAEFDQEFSKAAGQPVTVSFTPHLMPANRGILSTCYVKGDPQAIHNAFENRYADETFLQVLPFKQAPATRHVRASNFVHIGVVPNRMPGHAIVVVALDNLTKGSSGQAIQNANLLLGFAEETGLMAAPVFP